MKLCNKCNKSKKLEDFTKDKSAKSGIRNICKSCTSKRQLLWNKKNPEYRKNWKDTNVDKLDIYKNNQLEKYHRTKHLTRTTKEYKAKKKIWDRTYRIKNRGKLQARDAAREAGKIQATPKGLTKEHKKQMETIYQQCSDKTASTGILHHVDHIYPLRGDNSCGLHVPWNLQILTAKENIKKSNKLPQDYKDAKALKSGLLRRQRTTA